MLTIKEWMKENDVVISESLSVLVGGLVIPKCLWDSVQLNRESDISITRT